MMDFSKVRTGEETYADVIRRYKAQLPPNHPSLNIDEERAGQTVPDPSAPKPWLSLTPNPDALYEGFEEDVRRMRRGLEPIGPRK